MAISLFDPRTYKEGLKKAGSALNKIRDYVGSTEEQKKEKVTGALEKIKSEVVPRQSTNTLSMLKGEYQPFQTQSKLPTVKDKTESSGLSKLKMLEKPSISLYGKGDTVLEKSVTGGKERIQEEGIKQAIQKTGSSVGQSVKSFIYGSVPEAFGNLLSITSDALENLSFDKSIEEKLRSGYKLTPENFESVAKEIERSKTIDQKTKDAVSDLSSLSNDIITKAKEVQQDAYEAAEYKMPFLIGSGGVSIVTAIGLTAISGGTVGPAIILASIEALPEYERAKESLMEQGFSEKDAQKKALNITATTGVGTALLEKFGLDVFLGKRGGKALTKMFASPVERGVIKGAAETAQEEAQTIYQNAVQKYGYDKTQDIFEGLSDTFWATFPITALIGIPVAYRENVRALDEDKSEQKARVAFEEKVKPLNLSEQEKELLFQNIKEKAKYLANNIYNNLKAVAGDTSGFVPADFGIGDMMAQGKITSQKTKTIGKTPGVDIPAPLPDTVPTTRLLDELQGKTEVSKQFIQDLTNRPEMKQSERELIRSMLDEYDQGKIPVQEFENKVRTALLPLDIKRSSQRNDSDLTPEQLQNLDARLETKYENITLPDDLRGNVENYSEFVYESPIKTSAGNVHFQGATDNYFAHTRIEDTPGDIRRVIEVQSDLFQKGRLEQERPQPKEIRGMTDEQFDRLVQAEEKRDLEIDKLEPYRNTWYERIIREEIKRAAQDGKSAVLFPTGETAMKIEGLGDNTNWRIVYEIDGRKVDDKLEVADLKVGEEILRDGNDWIITEVLGDGKFKAIQKRFKDLGLSNWEIKEEVSEGKNYFFAKNKITGDTESVQFSPENKEKALEYLKETKLGGKDESLQELSDRYAEEFDISGKPDTNNPIYKYYEKQVQKYLKKEYGNNFSQITDDQGVTWYQVEMNKKFREDVAQRPVYAYKQTPETEGIPEQARIRSERKEITPEQQESAFKDKKSQVPKDIAEGIRKASKGNIYSEDRMLTEYLATKKLPEGVTPVMPTVKKQKEPVQTPDIVQPTAREVAKKYDTLEDFIDSDPKIYHGDTGKIKDKKQLRDFYMSGMRAEKAYQIKKATEDILIKQSERATKAEVTRASIQGITDEDIKLFDRVRRLKESKKFASGDIESLRKEYPDLVENAVERFNEATGQSLQDTEAFDEIMGLPTLKELREQERGLTREERQTLRLGEIISEKEIMQRRRTEIKAIKKFLNLTDADLRKVSQRDLRLMTNEEFNEYIQELRKKAVDYAENKQAKMEVIDFINRMNLKKWENLQKAMDLPMLSNMNTPQLRQFLEALEPYHFGDTFLSKRKLETVDRTDLKGIKTIREARERLAEEINVPVGELEDIKFEDIDRNKFDTALSETNPFYNMMVEEIGKSILKADASFLETKQEFLKLYKKAVKSRKKNVVNKVSDLLVPQQKNIVEYLEASPDQKKALAKDLTTEELELAHYMQEKYREVLDYHAEIEAEFGTRFNDDNYFTHIRRGILESVKEDGIIDSFKNVFAKYKQDAAVFNILDEDTGLILPLEKFFKFSQRRTGDIKPTLNVANSFLNYMQTFNKKQMFDRVIPKLDIYSHSLESQRFTPTGLEMDRSAIKFVKEWVNNKKGRRTKLLAKQGSKLDLSLRALKTLVSILDLGFSIPLGIATQVGERVTTYATLGKKAYTKGVYRSTTKKGKKILKEYENFIGENPWKELIEPGKGVQDRLLETLFVFFRDANVRANKILLLGSMSDQEYNSGEVSIERLAELRKLKGRFRDVEGSKSIIGSTPEAGIATQYLSWAIPILRTIKQDVQLGTQTLVKKVVDKVIPETVRDSNMLLKQISGAKTITKRQAAELWRIFEVAAITSIIFSLTGDDDDDTFLGELIKKGKRELSTLTQAVTPNTWFRVPRAIQFLIDLVDNLESIRNGERYKTSGEYYEEGELKGIRKIKKQFTPKLIKQFKSEEPREEYRVKTSYKKEVLPEEDREIYKNDLKDQVKDGSMTKEKAIEKMKEYDRWQGYMEDVEKVAKYIDSKDMDTDQLERFYNALQDKDFMKKKGMKPFNKTQMEALQSYGKTEVEEGTKMTKDQYLDQRGMLNLAKDYIKAYFTDPANALKAMFTSEKLGIVEGNLVELQRFYDIEYFEPGGSQDKKKKMMEDIGLSWKDKDKYSLEHILPVSAGGGTSDKNLKIIPLDEHDSYTPVDIALGMAVKSKNITRKEAEDLSRKLKIDKTMTHDEVMEQLNKEL